MSDRTESKDVLLLVRLTELLELSCDRATALRHVEAAQREVDSRREAFALAAQRANLRVTPFEASLDEAVKNASRETPIVAQALGSEKHWAVLLDRRGSKLLALLDPDDEPRWMPTEELETHLYPADGNGEVDWLYVHSAVPVAAAESPKAGEPTPPLARLMGILRPDRSDLWAVVVFSIVIGGLLLATPIAVQALVNFVAFGGAVAPVFVLALMLAVGLGFAAMLSALQAWIVEILQRRVFVRMVSDLSHRLPRVHQSTFDKSYGPELVNRFFDVITVQKMSSMLLLDGLGVVLGVVIGMIVLAFYHPILLAFDLLIILAVIGIVFLLGRTGIQSAIKESKSKYAVASWLEDIARSPTTFKMPAARDFVVHRSDELARNYVHARRTHYRVLFRQIIGMLGLQVAASVALLGLGGVLVIRGELTLGQLVASELIVTYVVSSIAQMGKHFESFYDLMAATDKLGNLLDLELERPTGDAWSMPAQRSGRGAELCLQGVDFFSRSGREHFDGFSIDIAPGERVGFTGPSGFGKSTLLEMLYGNFEPEAGLLEIDGVDVRSLRLEALRERVALISSTNEVFEGSVLDNILLGRSVPPENLHETLKKVGLTDALAALPEGVRTRLTQSGVPLSDGEIHRLMIARSIVGAPRLLMVDALLDGMSERSLDSMLDLLTDREAPWTLLLVSNRDEVLKRCDRVIDFSHVAELERSAAV
ncbi:MAG: ATP-binding cassette domain-containing protein [Acidobacteriota bacterium]